MKKWEQERFFGTQTCLGISKLKAYWETSMGLNPLSANRPPGHEVIHNVIAHRIFERSNGLTVTGAE